MSFASRPSPRWLLLSLAIGACARNAGFDEHERREVAAAVDSAVREFESAQRARSAERAIALLAPDFVMYTDGVKQGRDSIAASIRQSFATLQHLEPGFTDIEVRPMSERSALAWFRFRDSVVAADGATMRFTGATTLLWELRGGQWQMTYGHADHRPVP